MKTMDAPTPSAALREMRFRVGEMDCSSCLAKIERHLRTLDGVRAVNGSVLGRTLAVTVEEGTLPDRDVESEVGRLGYRAEPLGREEAPEEVSTCSQVTPASVEANSPRSEAACHRPSVAASAWGAPGT